MLTKARWIAPITAVALIVLLAGCATTQPPVPSPSVDSSSNASAPAAIVALANGDCEQLLDPAALASGLGVSTDARVGNTDLPLGLVGGIGCYYFFGEQGSQDSGEVYVRVAPAVVADPGEITASLAPAACEPDGTDLVTSNSGCEAIVAVGDWWYSIRVVSYESAQAQRTGFETVSAVLDEVLQSTEAPENAPAAESFDCAAADTGGLPVTGSRETPESAHGGVVAVAAFLLAGPESCVFTTDDGDQWLLEVYPNGATAYDQCATPASLNDETGSGVAIPGVASAFVLPEDSGRAGLCATDGTSLVQVWHEMPDAPAGTWDAASLATAGTLLTPVFEAAA